MLSTSLLFFLLLFGFAAADGGQLSPPYNHFYEFPVPIPPLKVPLVSFTKPNGGIIDYYEIRIENFAQQVYPELGPTYLVGYDGISPGPTFRIETGREAVVRFINVGNDKATVTHLHGSDTHPPWDGWAEDTIPVGFFKDYYYPNTQSAHTLWYHDHAVGHTAENAYFGQAGFYILTDEEEAQSGLPSGRFDIPLALTAKQYQPNGELVSPAGNVDSLFGDIIHVNGQPWPFLDVEPRKYRFRLLDASISRTFRLYFVTSLDIMEDDTARHIPFHVVGSDTGRTSRPVETSDVWLSMAERWEVVFDFAPYAGKPIFLKNFFDTQTDPPFNSTDQVMKFNVGAVVTDATNNGPLPAAFKPLALPPGPADLAHPDHIFDFEHKQGEWKINGAAFADVNNRILARPPHGTVQLWKLVNRSGGWSHPIHPHLVEFHLLARQNGHRGVLPYEAAAMQDTVLLGENEEVFVLARFAPFVGLYMFHCHNIVHEDHDMMAAFNVTALEGFNYPPQNTHFVDPLDPRFVSQPFDPKVQTLESVQDTVLPFFASLNAYEHAADVVTALESFLATATGISDTAPVQSEFNPNRG